MPSHRQLFSWLFLHSSVDRITWQEVFAGLFFCMLVGMPVAKAEPYQRVPAILDGRVVDDHSFFAARDELLAVVVRSDRAALNKRVDPTFFWERDQGGMYNRKRPAAANLAAATSWKSLRSMLSAEAATLRRPGSADHCLPARARAQDEKQFERLAEQLKTDPFFDWGVISSERRPARERPDATSAEVGSVTRELVRVTDWAFDTPEGRQRWVEIVLPTGTKGYVDGRHIQTLAPEQLCLRKDRNGVWRISGYIGGGE
jgi:hypothetical protein